MGIKINSEKRKAKKIILVLTVFVILVVLAVVYFLYIARNGSEFGRYGGNYVILDNGSLGVLLGTENNHPNRLEMVLFKFIDQKTNYIDWQQ